MSFWIGQIVEKILDGVNRRFYENQDSATEFSATRRNSWPGWQRAFSRLSDACPRVLDLGAGNGRLYSYLLKSLGDIEYLGVERSEKLLNLSEVSEGRSQIRQGDLLDPSTWTSLPSEWKIVSLLAVLHHIPSEEARRTLVARAAQKVASGGILVLSIWQFLGQSPSSKKIISLYPLPRDYIVRWQKKALRYCHLLDEVEIQVLIKVAVQRGLVLEDRFYADGRRGKNNIYLVFRK